MNHSPTNLAAYRIARCKVQIGSRYTGPALDRPALRQMPREWVLEEVKPPRRISPDGWVLAAAIMGWLFCFVQTALEMSK